MDTPTWLADWHKVPQDLVARRNYVKDELKRLAADGAPILAAVLTADALPQSLALSVLNRDAREVFGGPRVWYLRLADGAVPPATDPYGRPMPPEERGKVLIAKTGVMGPEGDESPDAWSGSARAKRVQLGRPIYHTVRITREPVAVELAEALTILRQWGVGVRAQRYRNRNTPTQMDTWLVEEVPAPGAARPAKGRAA